MKLQINEPCHEPWDAMEANPNGRHCSKCDKTVLDFSTYKDEEIMAFFKQHKNVCGRFLDTQLNRELSVRNKYQLPLKYAACGLIVLSAFGAQAQVNDSVPAIPNVQILDTRLMNTGNNMVKIKVTQPEESEKKIVKMLMEIDTFKMAIDLDSSNAFSYHIPTSLFYVNQMQSRLINQKGDTVTLTVVLNTFGKDYTFISTGETWSYYSNLPILPDVLQFTWGPPISFPIVNLRLPALAHLDSITTVTYGFVTNVDSTNMNSDSQYEYKKLDKTKYKVVKDKTRVWYWWVGGFLAVIGGWFLRKRSRKLEE